MATASRAHSSRAPLLSMPQSLLGLATHRFQNNTAISVLAPGPDNYGGGYFQPEVAFNAAAPNAAGNGLGLQGDSGGPLLIDGGSASVMVLSATPANGGAPAGQIPVNFTDNEFAEYVANIPPPTPVPSLEFAVPLVGPNVPGTSLYWALNYADNPMSIPEPGSLSMAATAGVVALLAVPLRTAEKDCTAIGGHSIKAQC